MRIGSWLKNWPRRRNSMVTSVAVPAQSERLEPRALLSSSALVIGTELNIHLDTNQNLRISAFNGNVLLETASNGGLLQPLASIGSVQASSIQSIVITGGDLENNIDLSPVLAANYTNLKSINVNAGNGDDSITGSNDFPDNILGGDGKDTIDGQGGNDTLNGGDGADVIRGGGGNNNVIGGDGADTITTGAGNDTVDAGNGSDVVDLGDGNDSLFAGNGEDSVLGGDGNDTLNGDGGADTVDGGAGDDSILGGELRDSLTGGTGNDTINGQAGNDTIDGGAGNDSLLGGVGNDSISGRAGTDTINGDAGNDRILGGDDADQILGGSGNDFVNGGLGDDVVQGQAGQDTLIGGGGADTLNGGTGNDFMYSALPDIVIAATGSIAEQNIGSSVLTFAVTLAAPSLETVTVDFTTQDGSATAGADYLSTFGTLTFAPGITTQTISVSVLGDTAQEGDETFNVILSNPTNGQIGRAQGQATIIDDDAPGVLGTISIGDVTILEGDSGTSNADFIVTLSQPSTQTITASFTTQNGTALAPQDYLTTTGTVTFAPGQTSQTVSIPIVGDTAVESTEFFFVRLSNLVNVTALDVQGVCTISDGPNGFASDISSLLNTITFDEVPTQPIGGLTVEGTTFAFTVGGVANTDATFNTSVGPSLTTVIQPPNLEGTSSGVLTMNFINPIVTLSFGIARSTTVASIPIGVRVQLFDATNTLVQTTDLPLNVINLFVEGTFSYSGSPIVRAVADFSVAGNGGGARFAMDNLTTDDNVLPPPPPPPPPPIVLSDTQGDTFIGGDGNDTVLGSPFADVINGGAGDDLVNAREGDDSIQGGAGNDTLFGEDGDDTLNGQAGTDVLDGGNGHDTVIWEGAGSGNDSLGDTVGDNTLLVNGNGASNIFSVGQNANGLLTVSESGRSVTVGPTFNTITVNAGTGDDTVNVGDLSLVNGVLLSIQGGVGNDLLSAVGSPIENVRLIMDGGDGNDTVLGGLGDETLQGSAGKDLLNGGGGNDTLSGGIGNDTIDGGAGKDSVDGDAGQDIVRGSDGDDIVNGGVGNDTVDGGIDNDTLSGNDGNDSLSGGIGNDSLLGGNGLDILSGDDGNDTLDGGFNNDSLSGGNGDDKIRGDHGSDSISGDDGNDTINGGDGNDLILAGLGNDLVDGADGDDTINGAAGNDILVGGDGNDNIRGGGGSDIVLGQDGDDNIDGQGGTDTVAGNQGSDVTADPLAEIHEAFTLSLEILDRLNAL